MPDASRYDMAYRPPTYWPEDPDLRLLSRIKGEFRKRDAKKHLDFGELEEFKEFLLQEELPPREREITTGSHPWLLGGEYLPAYEGDEVEIARLTLKSVTLDVISLRAARCAGVIRYRILDEYAGDFEFRFAPESSPEPLTMSEVVGLISGTEQLGVAGHFPACFRDVNLGGGDEQDARALIDFVTVTSDFYPQLEAWYAEEACEWFDRLRAQFRRKGGQFTQ